MNRRNFIKITAAAAVAVAGRPAFAAEDETAATSPEYAGSRLVLSGPNCAPCRRSAEIRVWTGVPSA